VLKKVGLGMGRGEQKKKKTAPFSEMIKEKYQVTSHRVPGKRKEDADIYIGA